MAVIREVLRLENQFSATMNSYLRMTQNAAGSTQRLQSSARRVTATVAAEGNAFNAASNLVRRQTAAIRFNTAALQQLNSMQLSASIAADIANADLRRQQSQMNRTATSANVLTRSIRQLAGAYLGIQGAGAIAGLSDNLVSVEARLNLINDGLKSTGELQNMIYQAANNARGSYVAMSQTVSKLGILAGDAFDSNKELVRFAELLNKNFVVGGAAAQEQTAAMYQLTQAMASGRLQGDEYRSIIENAPLLAQAIEDYMRNVQGATGSMKDWASQGLLTSDVIKAAMFSAADQVEERFAAMPTTWAQAWQRAKNISIAAFSPLLDVVGAAAGFVGEHIEAFVGGFYGLALAVGAYSAAQLVANARFREFVVSMLKSPLMPLAATFMVIGAAVGVFIKRCGGARAALLTFYDAALTGGQNLKIAFVSLLYHVQNKWDGFVVDFWTGIYRIQNAIDYLIAQVARISYGDAAIEKYENKKAARASELANTMAQRDNNIAKRSGIISEMKTARDTAHMARLQGIEDAKAAAVGSDDYSKYGSSMAANIAGIAGDTRAIKNSVDMSDETLKMLLDMTERRYVNNINLTAQSPVIQISGQNTGDTMADRYKLADTVKDVLLEQASAGATRSTVFAF